jgi:hypothetical protein
VRQGKRDEAHDLLAPVYDWFTEGFDTLDLKEAKGAVPLAARRPANSKPPRCCCSDESVEISLSPADGDMQQNLRLLEEGGWFEVSIAYGNGSRAVLGR